MATWNVIPCSPVSIYRSFRWTCCLQLQVRRLFHTRHNVFARHTCLAHSLWQSRKVGICTENSKYVETMLQHSGVCHLVHRYLSFGWTCLHIQGRLFFHAHVTSGKIVVLTFTAAISSYLLRRSSMRHNCKIPIKKLLLQFELIFYITTESLNSMG
jgi:hypothetical protein